MKEQVLPFDQETWDGAITDIVSLIMGFPLSEHPRLIDKIRGELIKARVSVIEDMNQEVAILEEKTKEQVSKRAMIYDGNELIRGGYEKDN